MRAYATAGSIFPLKVYHFWVVYSSNWWAKVLMPISIPVCIGDFSYYWKHYWRCITIWSKLKIRYLWVAPNRVLTHQITLTEECVRLLIAAKKLKMVLHWCTWMAHFLASSAKKVSTVQSGSKRETKSGAFALLMLVYSSTISRTLQLITTKTSRDASVCIGM